MAVAQFQILNKVLQTEDYSLILNNNLSEQYFFDYTAEYNFIKNHFNQYNKVPSRLTFKNIFQDFIIKDITEPDDYLIEAVLSEFKKNFLVVKFNEMKVLLENGDVEKAERLFNSANEDLSSQGTALKAVDLFTDISRYDRYEDRTKNKNKYYLSTGLPELDAVMGGIDRENENMVISARTGVGKTQLLCKIAVAAAAQGLRVGFYEGEMTSDKLGARIDTMYGHISNTSINRGDLFIQREYKTYIESLPQSGKHLFVLTPADVPGPVTVDVLHTFVKTHDLDLLLIDQYSLLDNPGRRQSEWEKIADISKKVKQLQVKTKIPVVSVVQMNRTKNQDENGNDVLDATQISGSDRIGQDATSILMLQVKDGVLTINIAKARDGARINKLKYQIDFNLGTFNYIPVEGDTIATEEDFENIDKRYTSSPEQCVLDVSSEDMPF